MNKAKILAVDFDGTIVEATFPGLGKVKPGAIKYIRQLYEDGYIILINTCRTGAFEGHAAHFLDYLGIPYHYINSNYPAQVEFFKQDSRKLSADLYIDDKCLMGLPDTWEEIYNLIKEKLPI